MSALSDVLANVFGTIADLSGVTITYTRGADSVSLTAVPGRTPVELLEGDDVVEQLRYTDWLIDPAELLLAGSQVEPRRNDQITVADTDSDMNGNLFRCTELPIDRQVWRYSEEHARAWIRVHSLLVDDGASL